MLSDFLSKKVIFLTLPVFIIICVQSVKAQLSGTRFTAVTPHYERIFSQVEINTVGLQYAQGFYDHVRFYFYGNLGLSYGQNGKDKYERTSKMLRVSPGVSIRWMMLGKNRYWSMLTWENTRLCVDAGLTGHISNSSLYYGKQLFTKKTIFYPSVDFGGSLLIPFGYAAKHRSHFLNRSDLFLSVRESLLIKRDVSLIVSTGSKIKDITFSSGLGLSWIYYW